MSAHAVPADSVIFALLNACGETPLTTAQVATRAGVSSSNLVARTATFRESRARSDKLVDRLEAFGWVRQPEEAAQ